MRHTFHGGRGRKLNLRRLLAFGLGLLTLVLVVRGPARSQQVHRNGFEQHTTAWVKGPADAVAEETAHEVTDQTAHSGQYSEHIQLNTETGTFVHYLYPLGRAPLTDELSLSVWLKANRPGPQLLARLVLPKERNPSNLSEPLTVVLHGDSYEFVGRWQRLELRKTLKLAKEQQQLLRAELNRDVDFTDAYIDRLVLNVYGGPGLTDVWLDDLEAGPLTEPVPDARDAAGKAAPAPGVVTTNSPPATTRQARGITVEQNQERLFVGGKRFLFRAIRHTDTPLKALHDAGFNTVFLDATAPATLRDEAVNLGFWLVPTLPVDTHQPLTSQAAELGQLVSQYPDNDAVLEWYMGGGHTIEEAPAISRLVREVHAADPQKPIGIDVWDGFMNYSRQIGMVGAHRWPLMTTLELPQYREWLNQRRLLAEPGTFQWTWIQTHLPDWYTSLVLEHGPDAGSYSEPIGPQPEQIRLLTYVALAAGCQGLGFWSDRFLADSHQGRDRLLQMALLNQEMQMLEPLLLASLGPPVWIETSHPDIKAAVMRTDRGVLVLPMWLGSGAQFVPGQSALSKLSMVVPQVPNGTQAWEATPGDVRSLIIERVPGGTKVTLPEFGLTSSIVFTADNGQSGLLARLQDQSRRMRKLAAQWSHDLAVVEIEKVLKVEAELERTGHTVPDGKDLQDDARKRLKRAEDSWNTGDFREAYFESQRSLRPLRILMRAQWEKATRELESPVASPYAVSFFTLPKHWEYRDKIQQAQALANVLPGGDFEDGPDQAPGKWLPQEVTIDPNLLMGAWRVLATPDDKDKKDDKDNKDKAPSGTTTSPGMEKPAISPQPPLGAARGQMPEADDVQQAAGRAVDAGGNPLPAGPRSASESKTVDPVKKKKPKPKEPKAKSGDRCLKLEIKPKDEELPPPAVLERTFLAINSPAVKLPPGTLVRVSGWVLIPGPIGASVDGALFYDSVGGEPLALRLTAPIGKWKKLTLYRRIPESGSISVTLALTGLGTVYFDDVRIEPLQLNASTSTYHAWSRGGETQVQGTGGRP